jgi:hypothetical protein
MLVFFQNNKCLQNFFHWYYFSLASFVFAITNISEFSEIDVLITPVYSLLTPDYQRGLV